MIVVKLLSFVSYTLTLSFNWSKRSSLKILRIVWYNSKKQDDGWNKNFYLKWNVESI